MVSCSNDLFRFDLHLYTLTRSCQPPPSLPGQQVPAPDRATIYRMGHAEVTMRWEREDALVVEHDGTKMLRVGASPAPAPALPPDAAGRAGRHTGFRSPSRRTVKLQATCAMSGSLVASVLHPLTRW